MTQNITGHCDDQFRKLRDVMQSSLSEGEDLGAGVTVIVDGNVALDLRGGYRDRKQTEEFGDSLTCVYSCGKAITAALIMGAISEGLVAYETKIAEVWPAFGAHGKDALTLGDALSHQTGLAAFMEPIDPSLWLDWDGLCAALADTAPIWPPGSASGYHPQTYGYIVGEVYRRVTGQTIGAALADISAEVHCGMGADLISRISPMVKPPAAPDLGELTDLRRAAFLSKWSSPAGVSREDWYAAEIPASNMHATSRGLAELMQAFATGRLASVSIPTAIREAAIAERIRGYDLVLPFELSWGAGVMRNVGEHYGPSPTAVGHYGFGGSCVVADPAHRLSFAYVPNKMSQHLVRDPRALALLEELYDVL